MPAGASPQLVVAASGRLSAHREGERDLWTVIASQGASIASSKKIVSGGRFALLATVWCPEQTIRPAKLRDVLLALGPSGGGS